MTLYFCFLSSGPEFLFCNGPCNLCSSPCNKNFTQALKNIYILSDWIREDRVELADRLLQQVQKNRSNVTNTQCN